MNNRTSSENNSVCIIGTLVSEDWFRSLQKRSKVKAAASPIFMQKMLFKSLQEAGNDVTCFGYPPIAAWPGSSLIGALARKVEIDDGLWAHSISFINIHFLKEISVFVSMLLSILNWNIKNIRRKRSIIVYADFLEYALPALIMGKLFSVGVVLLLTEMPGIEHYHKGRITVKKRILFIYERIKRKVHLWFDGYIFISKPLEEAVNLRSRPFTVVEGFPDEELFSSIPDQEKEKIPTIMYAGSLGAAYNIQMLVDAFRKVKGDFHLWIFGVGEYTPYVEKAAEEDHRITYFGVRERKEVLLAEKKATVLAHVKSDLDSFSSYSFSSKIMEYMASGTPMITSIVGGIPSEYYQYCYVLPDLSVDTLSTFIQKVLSNPEDELKTVGNAARSFLKTKKSSEIQAEKINKLLDEVESHLNK